VHCLDCDARDMTAPALGVCTGCGAGVCGAHLRVVRHALTCATATGGPVPVAPAVRRLLCPTCDQVRRAFARCCPNADEAVPAG
jgi:hypothetical protein